MAHFAKLDENNVVLAVHVVNNDVLNVNGIESEQAGVDFLKQLYGHNKWLQTSYNTYGNKHNQNGIPFRGNYAGIGYVYDDTFDVFIAPKPYPSWKLNYETFLWEAPVSKPEDEEGYVWKWFEINQEWIKVTL